MYIPRNPGNSCLELLLLAGGSWFDFSDNSESGQQSQGHRIYWKSKRTVTIERSLIFTTEENGGLCLDIEVEEEVECEGEREEENRECTDNTFNSLGSQSKQ